MADRFPVRSGEMTGKPPVPVVLVLSCSFVFLVAASRGIAPPRMATAPDLTRMGGRRPSGSRVR